MVSLRRGRSGGMLWDGVSGQAASASGHRGRTGSMAAEQVFAFAAVGMIALLCQWLAWAVRVPAILPLLLAGILLGPVAGVLDTDELFGGLLFPFVSMSVAVILFEGALSLKIADIRGHGKVVTNLITWGLLVSFALISLAAWLVLGLSGPTALLVGAVSVVTGPTVIAPLLRVVRPCRSVDQILRWEGILIDPVGAVFAVLVFQLLLSSRHGGALLSAGADLAAICLSGLLLGGGGGWLFDKIVSRGWLPRPLRSFGMLAWVLLLFAGAELLAHESGLLVVTVMGLWLANWGELDLEEITEFKENLSVILLSTVFVLLAARLDLGGLLGLGWPLLVFLAIVQWVVRPAGVWLSTFGQALDWREKVALGWIAPRGIVAAAVSSLFALAMAEQGFADADKLVSVVFAIILGTVILQSLTAKPLLSALGLRRPPSNGVLIVGANRLAREIGLALQEQHLPVLMADPVWENYRLSRMAGLPAYYGVPQSEQAEAALDLAGMGVVLALSANTHQNALAVYHFSHLLGEDKVFALRSSKGEGGARRESALFRRRQLLFAAGEGYAALARQMLQGWVVKTIVLDEHSSWQDVAGRYSGDLIPLVWIDVERPRAQPSVSIAAPPAGFTTLVALVNTAAAVSDEGPPAAGPEPALR